MNQNFFIIPFELGERSSFYISYMLGNLKKDASTRKINRSCEENDKAREKVSFHH